MENRHQYHFLYKTTNLLNNKYYIGVHSTYNLDDGYLGSGYMLKSSIKKYGKENFKIQILEFFENRDELVEAEKRIVTESLVADKMCMNLKPGGSGGFNKYWVKRGSELGVEALKEKRKDEEWMKMLSEIMSLALKRAWADGKFKKENPQFTFLGKLHTDETKKKIGKFNSVHHRGNGNSQYGTMWIYNVTLKENKKIKKSDIVPDGWIRGRKMSF
jgi:hypothetical protein